MTRCVACDDDSEHLLHHIFSGRAGRADGLAALARKKGCGTREVDVLNDPAFKAWEGGGSLDRPEEHDVTSPELQAKLDSEMVSGRVLGLMLGTPCNTYSVARMQDDGTGVKPVRDRQHIYGLPNLSTRLQRTLNVGNALSERSIVLARAAHARGVPWVIENPIDRGDPSKHHLFHRVKPGWANHGPLWMRPDIQKLQADTGAKQIDLAQCMLGSSFQKYTTLLVSADIYDYLKLHLSCACKCLHEDKHPDVATGRDEDGGYHSRKAAAYPERMNEIIVGAFVDAAQRRVRGAGSSRAAAAATASTHAPPTAATASTTTAAAASTAAPRAPPPLEEVLAALNAQQRRAVETDPARPLTIFAPFGSGKTHTLCARIRWLVEGPALLPPERILALSFTRKAAAELRGRLALQHGGGGSVSGGSGGVGGVRALTFHSWGLEVLQSCGEQLGALSGGWLRGGFRVTIESRLHVAMRLAMLRATPEQAQAAAAAAAAVAPGRGADETELDKRAVELCKVVEEAKESGSYDPRDPESAARIGSQHAGPHIVQQARAVASAYARALRRDNLCSLGDVLLHVRAVLSSPHAGAVALCRLRSALAHLLVDEVQDANKLQLELLCLLCSPAGSGSGSAAGGVGVGVGVDVGRPVGLSVVGDDDQAIYVWRGATREVFGSFSDGVRFPNAERVVLETVYRCSGAITAAATALIARSADAQRVPKAVRTDNARGAPVELHECCGRARAEAAWLVARVRRLVEVEGVPRREVAVLTRNNKVVHELRDALRAAGVRVAEPPRPSDVGAQAIKGPVMCALRLLANRDDDAAFREIAMRFTDANGASVPVGTLLRVEQTAAAASADEALSLHGAAKQMQSERGAALTSMLFEIDRLERKLLREAASFDEMVQLVYQSTLVGIRKGGGGAGSASAGGGGATQRGQDSWQLRDIVTRIKRHCSGGGGGAGAGDAGGGASGQRSPTTGDGRLRALRSFVEAELAERAQAEREGDELLPPPSPDDEDEGVSVSTIHAAKGREWRAVLVARLNEGARRQAEADGTEAVEEERRLLYVAMTRAKQRLLLSTVAGDPDLRRSRFLQDLERAGCLVAADDAAEARQLEPPPRQTPRHAPPPEPQPQPQPQPPPTQPQPSSRRGKLSLKRKAASPPPSSSPPAPVRQPRPADDDLHARPESMPPPPLPLSPRPAVRQPSQPSQPSQPPGATLVGRAVTIYVVASPHRVEARRAVVDGYDRSCDQHKVRYVECDAHHRSLWLRLQRKEGTFDENDPLAEQWTLRSPARPAAAGARLPARPSAAAVRPPPAEVGSGSSARSDGSSDGSGGGGSGVSSSIGSGDGAASQESAASAIDDSGGAVLVGKSVKLYWNGDRKWFKGTITRFYHGSYTCDDGTPVAAAPLHFVVYKDGDTKQHCLADGELWEVLPEPERKRQR